MVRTIVNVITTYSGGGAEKNLQLLCSSLSLNNYVYIFYLNGNDDFQIRLDNNCIVIGPCRKNPWRSIKLLYRKIMVSHTVMSWLYHADIITGLFRVFVPFNWILNTRTSYIKNRVKGKITRRLLAILSKPANVLVFNSYFARNIHVNDGYDSSKVVVIYNGFMDKPKLDVAKSQKRIAWLGRNHHDKGIDKMILFIKRNYQWLKRNKFTIHIGGVDFVEVRNLFEDESYLDVVFFEGRVATYKLLRDKGQFILSSRTESFPNVIIEALQSGCRVLSPNVGDVEHFSGEYLDIIDFNNELEIKEILLANSKLKSQSDYELPEELKLANVLMRYRELLCVE